MKFTYDDELKTTTIKKYKIKNGKLIITYLSGKTKSYEYTKEKELEIQEKMILQAEDRNNKLDNVYFIKKTFEYCAYIIIEAIISNLLSKNLSKAQSINNIDMILFVCLVDLFNDILFIYTGIKITKYINKSKEYVKYKIYLSILKDLKESINNKELSNYKKDILNINNLDSYSLKKIEKLKCDLNNVKRKVLK